ncbi:MAG TPA: SMC-Scp complex subunit ScpB [Candidatus Saccharimonadales bacterium]|nr:SMC-Scp complex subunit ScpB [Candidatus Saccharimonadales bacterium]
MNLKAQLESLLFVSIKPLSLKELVATLNVKPKEAELALAELAADYKLAESGLALIKNNNQYQLTTNSENAALVKDFLKSETSGELSQPSLEALTIIAYRGPISKLELEKIRGINCSLIIRNLLIRGLIEEKFEKNKQENYYTVSLDFIRFLGLGEISQLPDYERMHRAEEINEALADKSVEIASTVND